MKISLSLSMAVFSFASFIGCKTRTYNSDSKAVAGFSEGAASRQFVYSLKGDVVTRATCPFALEVKQPNYSLADCKLYPAKRKWSEMVKVLDRIAKDAHRMNVEEFDSEIAMLNAEAAEIEQVIKKVKGQLKAATTDQARKVLTEDVEAKESLLKSTSARITEVRAERAALVTSFRGAKELEPLLKETTIHPSDSSNAALKQYSPILFRAFVEANAFEKVWIPGQQVPNLVFDIHDYSTIWHLKAKADVKNGIVGDLVILVDEENIKSGLEMSCYTDSFSSVRFICNETRNAPMTSKWGFMVYNRKVDVQDFKAVFDTVSKAFEVKAIYR